MNNPVKITAYLHLADYAVWLLSLLLTVAAVLWGNYRKQRQLSEEENFLDLLIMGRKLTLPFFVATLVATWYGGIFGVTRIAYEQGIFNFVTQGVFWYLTYLIFAFLLVGKISAYRAVSLPDLVGQMFGPRSAKLAAIFNFFNVLPVTYVVSIGLLLQMMFDGSLLFMMIIGTFLVVCYSMGQGLRSIIYSDLVQFFFMCTSVAIVVVIAYYSYGGLGFLQAKLPPSHFSLQGGESILSLLAWALIALATLVDPNFYQRVFAAANPSIAKRGIIISTIIWLLFDLCTTLGGMYARAVLPETASSQAYLHFALQILPVGLRGFFLAGITATILSTLDSYLFLASSTLTYDCLRRKNFRWPSIFISATLAIFLGTFFDGNIKLIWKTLGSFSSACLLVPMMLGHLFPGKIKDRQFFVSSLLGAVAIIAWKILTSFFPALTLDGIYIGIFASASGLYWGGKIFKN